MSHELCQYFGQEIRDLTSAYSMSIKAAKDGRVSERRGAYAGESVKPVALWAHPPIPLSQRKRPGTSAGPFLFSKRN